MTKISKIPAHNVAANMGGDPTSWEKHLDILNFFSHNAPYRDCIVDWALEIITNNPYSGNNRDIEAAHILDVSPNTIVNWAKGNTKVGQPTKLISEVAKKFTTGAECLASFAAYQKRCKGHTMDYARHFSWWKAEK